MEALNGDGLTSGKGRVLPIYICRRTNFSKFDLTEVSIVKINMLCDSIYIVIIRKAVI
jgi:hypothetical protein